MSLSFLLPRLDALDPFKEFLKSVKKRGHRAALQAASPLKPYLLAALFEALKGKIIVVASDQAEAADLARDIGNFTEAVLFPAREVLPREDLSPSKETAGRRLQILSQLAQPAPMLLVTSVRAVEESVPTRKDLLTPLRLEVGRELELDSALETLVAFDYERSYMVERRGEFSVRGGILDIYPVTEPYPVRVELVEDKVESIRTFSLATQRSIAPQEELIVYGAREAGLEDSQATLFDHLAAGSLVVWDELDRLVEGAETVDLNATTSSLLKKGQGVLELSSLGLPKSPFPVGFRPIFTEIGRVTDFERLRTYLADLVRGGELVVLVVEGKGTVDRLKELFAGWKLPPASILIVQGTLGRGFILPAAKLAVITETDIYGHRKEKRQERQTHTRSFFDVMDLEEGDYVVHLGHGIGRYRGLTQQVVDGIRRDYLVIEYAMRDRLYVPIDQLDMVQKYIGGEGVKPTVYRLGGRRWLQVKRKVKARARQLAADLLRLYAERKSLPGHTFSKDTPWQRELEEAFPYEETRDQLEAIGDIKRDMETASPMERLVCGDVGYGKTEVAIRAAFKAVLDGKQVAVLVPTTVLALQHARTFSERFAPFPIVVKLLSRLRGEREQKDVVERLKVGAVDVIIGTHRLLQKDVEFKDLGLVIIDEEQRFGVRHKEILKELRRQVDVLTLSATPIPRTLNLALLGVRDMSVIDTPPEDRYPVTTFVGRYSDRMVADAIRRELDRGGQVFFVHNRIQTIGRAADRLRKLVPEARIAVAHGQLDEGTLEKVMLDFVAKNYDVLVATTIIENGLDIPTVNTLVVDRAERLGLSQLYQLRGRVGRADLHSHAYFLYPAGVPLKKTAYERLKTIAEFTELGSGFRIALRDLEIRGAGNVLGQEQHGFINAVGFELYADLLREAVERLKGQPARKRMEVELDLPVEAYVPPDYIESDALRVDVYRRLAMIDSEEKVKEMGAELTDRYGDPPAEVRGLLDVVSLKLLARKVGVDRIRLHDRRGELRAADGRRTQIELPGKGEVVSLLRQVLSDIMGQTSKKSF